MSRCRLKTFVRWFKKWFAKSQPTFTREKVFAGPCVNFKFNVNVINVKSLFNSLSRLFSLHGTQASRRSDCFYGIVPFSLNKLLQCDLFCCSNDIHLFKSAIFTRMAQFTIVHSCRRQGCRGGDRPLPFAKFEDAALKIRALYKYFSGMI